MGKASREFSKSRNRQQNHDNEYYQPVASDKFKARHFEISPKSISQEIYLDALEDESKTIVVATGPAGTGKSYLATLYAIQCLLNGECQKIIITRPLVSAGEDIGFLPGSIFEKLAPWSIPILDIFKEIFPINVVERLIKEEILEIAPLGMLRGRTLKNAMIIAEELQNSTPEQCKMLFTRIGDNSRMIVTGDPRQHDRGHAVSGLSDFIERIKFRETPGIALCQFDVNDIERHQIVEEVLYVYGEA